MLRECVGRCHKKNRIELVHVLIFWTFLTYECYFVSSKVYIFTTKTYNTFIDREIYLYFF